MLCVYVHFNFEEIEHFFTKFGLKVMPLEDVPTTEFVIDFNS
jgi:hypothetical protein